MRLVVTSAELIQENAKTNILLRESGERHERKVFKSGRYHGNSWNFQVSSIQAYAGTERRNGKENGTDKKRLV